MLPFSQSRLLFVSLLPHPLAKQEKRAKRRASVPGTVGRAASSFRELAILPQKLHQLPTGVGYIHADLTCHGKLRGSLGTSSKVRAPPPLPPGGGGQAVPLFCIT